MQQLLYDYGIQQLESFNLLEKRNLFNINDEIGENEVNTQLLINIAIKNMSKQIDLTNYNIEFIERDNAVKYYLHWHIDDCAVFKHSNNKFDSNNEINSNNIKLNDKYSLFIKKDKPIYTMIIYLSTYNIDFKGGEFEFVDKIIYPKKYDVVFFDSREVHRVHEFKSGIRRNIIVKFYNKN